MDIEVAWAQNDSTDMLVANVLRQLPEQRTPSILFVFFNANHNAELIRHIINTRLKTVILMASSSHGAFANTPDSANAAADLTVFAVYDEQGHYGTGSVSVTDMSAQEAARQATLAALENSQVPYEAPAMLWCAMPSGCEEALLAGIADIVGEHIPVFGGTIADNDINGDWFGGDAHQGGCDYVTIAALYPSQAPGASYSSGYSPGSQACKVTAIQARNITHLNNAPAAEVYNGLTQNSIGSMLAGGSILALTTLQPLGRVIPSPAGLPEYLLSHPDAVTAQGGLSLFSQVEVDTNLVVMQGSVESLIERAEKVIANAIALLPDQSEPAGVLLVYCAGCMFTVAEQLPAMLARVRARFPALPIAGIYTFGEQGRFLDGHNRHGNLMISAVAFAK